MGEFNRGNGEVDGGNWRLGGGKVERPRRMVGSPTSLLSRSLGKNWCDARPRGERAASSRPALLFLFLLFYSCFFIPEPIFLSQFDLIFHMSWQELD